MPPPLSVLSTVAELEAAIARSTTRPIVIFKHSPNCGVSAQARELIAELPDTGTHREADWYIVPVQASRAVSTALVSRFGIRHESPQAMVVSDGRVVWHGSHFRATASGILAALEQLAPARG